MSEATRIHEHNREQAFDAEVRIALAKLDGSHAKAVELLSGMSAEQIESLGDLPNSR